MGASPILFDRYRGLYICISISHWVLATGLITAFASLFLSQQNEWHWYLLSSIVCCSMMGRVRDPIPTI